MYRYLLIIVFLGFISSCVQEKKTPRIAGAWVGDLMINENVSLKIGYEIKYEQDSLIASMASIDQGAYGIEVNAVTINGDSIIFEAANAGVIYTGLFIADTLIEGHFAQGSAPPLVLNLSKVESIPGAPPPRHQTPVKPYPYIEEDVEFESSISGLKLAGTLTIPNEGEDFSTVVLISGSGPNDRNETIWGHKVFLVLADHLTRAGIAVLRMDDRGVGGSTGDHSTASMSDFANDAVAAVNYLVNRKQIDLKRIGLIGHSLGADIAPMAANRNKEVSFIILMAGAGITLAETIHMQTEHHYGQKGASKEAINLNRRINQAVFDIGAMDIAKSAMETALAKSFAKLEPELLALSDDDRKKAELPGKLKPEDYYNFLSDNMRFDLSYNPSRQLEQLNHPVLILAGELDKQVSTSHNIPLMETALIMAGNTQFTTTIFPNVNHLFQTCVTGEINEYNQIGETIAPDVLNTMSDWINALE